MNLVGKGKRLFIAVLSILLGGCTGIPDGLQPVTGFEKEKYLGKWYEIARLDHRFERHMINVSAEYAAAESGYITVLNRGYHTVDEKWQQITGKARFIGDEAIGSLKVSFFGPFYGGYHIIALDKAHYRYAMVSGPRRSYLWILSRTRTMDRRLLAELVSLAGSWGFETDRLVYVEHENKGE